VVRTLLIVNPKASGVDPDVVAEVTRLLGAATELEVVATRERNHATEIVRTLPTGTERVFAMGGDGLFNEVANGIDADMPVGLLGAGASNVLPRALGLPRDAKSAAVRLATSTATRQISLGVANGRRFTFCCGLGIDAEVVRAVDGRGRRKGRRASDLAVAWELVRALVRRRLMLRPVLEVVDHGRCAFVIATNGDPYTYAGALPVHAAPLARFDAGVDIVAPRQLGPLGMLGLAWAVLARPGRQTRSARYIYLHDIDDAVVHCDGLTPLQLDGEDIGDVQQLELSVDRAAMTVLI
jgi:diacylglycerol kinase family enzyme